MQMEMESKLLGVNCYGKSRGEGKKKRFRNSYPISVLIKRDTEL